MDLEHWIFKCHTTWKKSTALGSFKNPRWGNKLQFHLVDFSFIENSMKWIQENNL